MIGSPYLWYKGDMKCTNKLTGEYMIINFKPKGWTSKNDYVCDGFVFDENGNKKIELSGMWNTDL